MAEGRTLLERMLGLALEKRGANLEGDSSAAAAADAQVKALQRSMSAGNSSAVERWPLPSLIAAARADQLEDEVGHYARLVP